ncbi:class I SAM-dependent methyltransferase [uncultured Microbacterium sp.]|uniref:class I SAM-dependent methyltransferase n=1 Tax=uncultured Microbacterium sp. TaxID=191216 RepID=UPI0025FD118E|nr:class I SAM-dependent methyltransferase [uncultured Microbacterium sp.]
MSADREIQHIIVPGRHHLLTRFQAAYLGELLAGRGRDENGEPIAVADGAVVVWAVTSANHSATRRNPFPGHRREAAIEILAHVERMPSIVVPVVDVAPTPRFAEITLKEIGYATAQGVIPAPETAIIATSTPQVADMYRARGYRIAPMEREHPDTPRTPWQLLDELMAGSDDWRADAHPASLDIVDRYGLAAQAREIAADPVIGDEGGLTPTRDYRTYSRAFEDAAERKWAQARPWIVPGRIVDLGCATGAMLELASQEPALAESDLIGVEIAPELFAACEHKKSEGAFANPNTFFYRRNILAGRLFRDRSIATTLSFALTHEIYSYGEGMPSLRAFASAIADHTVPGGVWINSDVCGPADPDRIVRLRMRGGDVTTPARELTGSNDEVAASLDALPVGSRVAQFAQDFRALSGAAWEYEVRDERTIELRLADAMEFLETVSYTRNWLSEMHEQFCALSWADWRELVASVGLEIDERSGPWRNDWLVENRFAPAASLLGLDDEPLDWPDTHMLLVARRPLDG